MHHTYTHIYMHPRVRAIMSISVISVSMSIIIRHETFSDHELNRSTMGRGENAMRLIKRSIKLTGKF